MTSPGGCPINRYVRGQEGVCPPSRQQVDVLAIYRQLAGRRDPEAAIERAERIRQQRLVRVLPELPTVLMVEQAGPASVPTVVTPENSAETREPAAAIHAAIAAGVSERSAIGPMRVPDELSTARFRRFGRGRR